MSIKHEYKGVTIYKRSGKDRLGRAVSGYRVSIYKSDFYKSNFYIANTLKEAKSYIDSRLAA